MPGWMPRSAVMPSRTRSWSSTTKTRTGASTSAFPSTRTFPTPFSFASSCPFSFPSSVTTGPRR
ncbi:hypothetical protein ACFQ0M_02020 [Kitasatospora aburaviensis]